MGEGCRSRVLTFEEHAAAAAPGHTAGRRVPEIEARGRLCAAERARALRGDVPELWDEAARAWEGLGCPYPAAYARWREAVAAMAAGDREAAARALARARAREGVDRLEAEPLRAVVATLAAEVGPVASVTASCPDPDRAASQTGRSSDPVSRSAEPPPADSHGLTPRELDVLRLVAEGHSNRKIGKELLIAEGTAAVHIHRIPAELGVASRAEAISLAYRTGLVEVPGDPPGPPGSGSGPPR